MSGSEPEQNDNPAAEGQHLHHDCNGDQQNDSPPVHPPGDQFEVAGQTNQSSENQDNEAESDTEVPADPPKSKTAVAVEHWTATVLAAATLGLVVIGGFQIYEMSAATTSADTASHTALRVAQGALMVAEKTGSAQISSDLPDLSHLSLSQVKLGGKLFNHGQTPSVGRLCVQATIARPNEPPPMTSRPIVTCKDNTYIAPQGAANLKDDGKDTGEGLASLLSLSSGGDLYIYGSYDYVTIFGEKLMLKFCRRYNYNTQVEFQFMEDCPSWNGLAVETPAPIPGN